MARSWRQISACIAGSRRADKHDAPHLVGCQARHREGEAGSDSLGDKKTAAVRPGRVREERINFLTHGTLRLRLARALRIGLFLDKDSHALLLMVAQVVRYVLDPKMARCGWLAITKIFQMDALANPWHER